MIREDDEIMRQLQRTQARISIWILLDSSTAHRDALIRSLSLIRVESAISPDGLIHMLPADRATCIVFSADDLPVGGSDHTMPLYITVGCSGHQVPTVLLDNGSALNVCPLATAVALDFGPSNFGPSTQTIRAYDSTRREVLGTLTLELRIGPVVFSTLFQVLRIPTSFNLLLGRPWIHRAGAIPSSLHQKVKFICEGRVISIQSSGDIYSSSEPVLEISHGDDDLFFTGFTFDDVQIVVIEESYGDQVPLPFDRFSGTFVLDMMRGMFYLPGLGLGRRQHGISEFIATMSHDVPFGLGYTPTEADYRYMASISRERLRARLLHIPFDYPVRPYQMIMTYYFVRASGVPSRLDISPGGSENGGQIEELFRQLQLADESASVPTSVLVAPPSPDRASMMTLYFPEEIGSHEPSLLFMGVSDGVFLPDDY